MASIIHNIVIIFNTLLKNLLAFSLSFFMLEKIGIKVVTSAAATALKNTCGIELAVLKISDSAVAPNCIATINSLKKPVNLLTTNKTVIINQIGRASCRERV